MQLAPSFSRSKVRGLYLFSLNEPQMSLLLVRMMVGAGLVSGPPPEDKRGKGGAWQTARVSWSSVIRQFGLGGGEGPLPSHCSVLACCRDYRESPRSGPFIVPKYDCQLRETRPQAQHRIHFGKHKDLPAWNFPRSFFRTWRPFFRQLWSLQFFFFLLHDSLFKNGLYSHLQCP